MAGSTTYVRFGNLLVTLPLLIVLALLILGYEFRYPGRGTVMGNL
jgi:hypothetical protein